jgi:hypothetical protein
LEDAARTAARDIRKALNDLMLLERMRRQRSKDAHYIDQHQAFPDRADEHKKNYRPFVDGTYICPICFIRHGQNVHLGELLVEAGMMLECSYCGYRLVPGPISD